MGDMGRNVLITRFSALGDIAMTLPSVYNVCRANPDAHFIFLTRPHPAKMFINAPVNLTVIGINLDNYKGIAGIWRLAKELMRKYRLTDIADLHDVLRTKLLRSFLRLRGVKTTHVLKNRKARKALTRADNKIMRPLEPMCRRYNDTFSRIGFMSTDSFTSVFQDNTSGKGDAAAFAAVSKPKQPCERWIAVAPFAAHPGKVYPLEKLEKVIAHFDARGKETGSGDKAQPIKIFVFGFGAEESAKIAEISSRYPSVVNMAEAKIGLPAELSLLSHCDIMISMDSANMHLASLAGLRCVSIWGATHPYAGFLGRRQNPEDAVQLDMPCRPCSVYGNKPCRRGDYACLCDIKPNDIINRIDQ